MFVANESFYYCNLIFTGLGRDDPFEVSCSRQVSSDQMTIIFNCVGNRAIVSQVCTLNEMEIPDCKLISLGIISFMVNSSFPSCYN